MTDTIVNNSVMEDLMSYYGAKTQEEIINKAISVLRILAYVDSKEGQVIARKGNQESRISI